MIIFQSYDELNEGDLYQYDFYTPIPTVFKVIKIDETWNFVVWDNPSADDVLGHTFPIKLDNHYVLYCVGNELNYKSSKWIDPRIAKARKEWGMEAVAIFA